MGVAAAATAGYAWLAGPLLALLADDEKLSSFHVFAKLADSGERNGAAEIVFALVLIGLVRTSAEALRSRVSARLQLSVVREFRAKILSHVLGLEPAEALRWPSGELSSRVQVEVHGVRLLLHWGLVQGIRSILVATALAIIAFEVDSGLATRGVIVVPIAAVVAWLLARPARRLQRDLYAEESRVLSDTAEAVDGALVLRAFGATEATERRIDAKAEQAERIGVAAETWAAAAGPVIELGAVLGLALALAMAWSTRGDLDVAAAGTVLVALLLMVRPLVALGQSLVGWFSGLSALDRLDELLGLPRAPLMESELVDAQIGEVVVDRVCFAYDDSALLEDASARFGAGELCVLVGASGAGKSTLLALLAGILEPSAGEICFDSNGTRADRARRCAWMPQSVTLFRGSFLDNIALGDDAPDRRRAIEAAKRAEIHEVIAARPGGYEGVIEEGGANLSIGQRQRLAFARLVYRDANVWLLDEPSSALDSRLEAAMIEHSLEHATRGGIVVVATHRQAWVRRAHRVWTLCDGVLTESKHRWESAHLN